MFGSQNELWNSRLQLRIIADDGHMGEGSALLAFRRVLHCTGFVEVVVERALGPEALVWFVEKRTAVSSRFKRNTFFPRGCGCKGTATIATQRSPETPKKGDGFGT